MNGEYRNLLEGQMIVPETEFKNYDGEWKPVGDTLIGATRENKRHLQMRVRTRGTVPAPLKLSNDERIEALFTLT